jgi:mannosyl-oligosaccharide glucosidase
VLECSIISNARLTVLCPIATVLSRSLELSRSTFQNRFQSVFQPKSPFKGPQYSRFSQSLLSNLLGGIGYFYGSSLVDISNQSEYEEEAIKTPTHSVNQHTTPKLTKAVELFSGVPSRAAFPRGFLWDEGFHQLLVLEWDLDLSIEILQSWLAVMDDSGWIAREYILGPEARSRVPYEFQIMYPHHANPPTIFFAAKAVSRILHGQQAYYGTSSKYLADKELASQVLQELLVKLKKHYYWFRETQKGNTTSVTIPDDHQQEVYRWRGRTSQHILASGLDDYPRPQPQSLGELHVDATSWVGLMATVLRDMSSALGRHEAGEFERHRLAIKESLDSIHWSSKSQSYCDTAPREKGFKHVCHLGYVSLMPFLVGLLEHDHLHLGKVLDVMRDERTLWSSYGLRSLSLSDEFYGKDENYWRGPIWVNINFLAIQRLLVRKELIHSRCESFWLNFCRK